jgi:hypothetical protein
MLTLQNTVKATTKNPVQSNQVAQEHASVSAFTQAKLEKALKSLEKADLNGIVKKSV